MRWATSRPARRLLATTVVGTMAVSTWPVLHGVTGAHRIFHPSPVGPGQRSRAMHEGAATTLTTSRDGLRLAVQMHAGSGPDTVIVSHGMGRNRSEIRRHVSLLLEAGLSVVTFDLRNHGQSGRDRALGDMAARHVADLEDVINLVQARTSVDGGRIVLLALSFSAWPALTAALSRGSRVAAVICDSGPALDIPRAYAHFFHLAAGSLPRPLQGSGARWLTGKSFVAAGRAMLDVRRWPPPAESPIPMLFIAGAEDRVVPAVQIAGVAERYSSARFWVAPNSGHTSAVRLDAEGYREVVLRFLSTVLTDLAPDTRGATVTAPPHGESLVSAATTPRCPHA